MGKISRMTFSINELKRRAGDLSDHEGLSQYDYSANFDLAGVILPPPTAELAIPKSYCRYARKASLQI